MHFVFFSQSKVITASWDGLIKLWVSTVSMLAMQDLIDLIPRILGLRAYLSILRPGGAVTSCLIITSPASAQMFKRSPCMPWLSSC